MDQPRDGTRPYDLDAVLRIGLSIGPTNEVRLDATGLLAAGPVVVDVSRHEAWLDAREVQLTAKELQLLAYLIHRGGRVANQHEISTAMWGHEADTNTKGPHQEAARQAGSAPGSRPTHHHDPRRRVPARALALCQPALSGELRSHPSR